MSTRTTAPAYGWPHLALVLGGSSSVAANVAHAHVASGSPPIGGVAASVLWPVFVFVAVELLISTARPPGWAWMLTRVVGVGLVALVAAVVSYRHMSKLLATYSTMHFFN